MKQGTKVRFTIKVAGAKDVVGTGTVVQESRPGGQVAISTPTGLWIADPSTGDEVVAITEVFTVEERWEDGDFEATGYFATRELALKAAGGRAFEMVGEGLIMMDHDVEKGFWEFRTEDVEYAVAVLVVDTIEVVG